MSLFTVLLFPLLPLTVLGQLVGSRGVITLPDGFQYKDQETVLASREVAQYAKHYQPLMDVVAQQNKLKEVQRSGETNESQRLRAPIYFPLGQQAPADNFTLYYGDVPYITELANPLIQTISHEAVSLPKSNSNLQPIIKRPNYSTIFHFNLNNIFGI